MYTPVSETPNLIPIQNPQANFPSSNENATMIQGITESPDGRF